VHPHVPFPPDDGTISKLPNLIIAALLPHS
jgi:hypothetical protein